MRIGIVGAGINGVCIGWELASAGHEVYIYERDVPMAHTSSASSKLLHGGLRYLEQGEFRLVREALKERRYWFDAAPHLAQPLKLCLPLYRSSKRGKLTVGLGLTIYDCLASGSRLPKHKWLNSQQLLGHNPDLNSEGLLGGFEFWDGQMDDRQLGEWAVTMAIQQGLILKEGAEVCQVSEDGMLHLTDGSHQTFDCIINAAGPWSSQLLQQSKIDSQYQLDLVKGSHIVLNRSCAQACLLEVPKENRIFFVLPWKEKTLIGTTEIRQVDPKNPEISEAETAYLLDAYNHYFRQKVENNSIVESFAGVRPLIKSASNPSQATREYIIERKKHLVTVFGGKWTTAKALARKVRKIVEKQ